VPAFASHPALSPPPSAPVGSWRERVPRWILSGLAIYSPVLLALFAVSQLVGPTTPRDQAIFLMAVGLVFLWIVLGGFLSWRFRDWVRAWMSRQPGSGPLQFVLLATTLVLIEEAITTTMTNLAPEFGSQIGVA
jgi:hypothetical protein